MIVGVDVSKARITVAVHGGDVIDLPNTEAGYKSLLERLEPGAKIAVESTGAYHRPLVTFLQTRRFDCYVLNPFKVKSFAHAVLNRNKTDALDAVTIAEYAWLMQDKLVPYQPLSDEHYVLAWLIRFADGMTQNTTAAKNRLHALEVTHPELENRLSRVVFDMTALKNQVYDMAAFYAASDVVLSNWINVLQHVPGIGLRSALQVVAYSGDITRFRSERAYAAYTGLTPAIRQSGVFRGQSHISRAGNPRLRSVFYLSAIAASRSHSTHGEYYKRLVALGKPKKRALVALAHRLARHCWRVCNPPKPPT